MLNLLARDLLGAWERGLGRGVAERAVILLRAAAGDPTGGRDPAQLPLGARDALLLDLYERAFGPEIDGLASCPQCDAEQEFQLRVSDLRLSTGDAAPPHEATLTCGGYQIAFRLPDSRDSAAIATASVDGEAAEAAVRRLLGRCIIAATQAGGQQPVSARDLPQDVVDAISARMAELDPQAEIELMMECVACRHRWPELLDVAAFLWSEINAWAMRTLGEVHQLAASYGWSEAEILAMSPQRRSFYIELIAG
jgi:hypothetical protein